MRACGNARDMIEFIYAYIFYWLKCTMVSGSRIAKTRHINIKKHISIEPTTQSKYHTDVVMETKPMQRCMNTNDLAIRR